jgi:hypothetical protein
MRWSAFACSDTMLTRLLQTISSSMPSIRLTPWKP